jgi:hypothetical protein
VDEVVDRHAAGDVVERLVREGQHRVGVEVVHDILGQHRVGPQLCGVHPEPDQSARCGPEVRDPRRHQIEDLAVDGELGVRRADRRDRSVVDVGDQPGWTVELRVRGGVHPVEEPGREHDVRHVSTVVPMRGHLVQV